MAGIILVTGGAGYIGSHACVALIEAGYQPVVVDNLVNSSVEVINRIERITGVRPDFIEADLLDGEALDTVFANSDIAAVMHFAGLKAVGESVEQPLAYYHNNVGGTISLLQAMERGGVQTLVFSSSATVYGEPSSNPMREDFPRRATNATTPGMSPPDTASSAIASIRARRSEDIPTTSGDASARADDLVLDGVWAFAPKAVINNSRITGRFM